MLWPELDQRQATMLVDRFRTVIGDFVESGRKFMEARAIAGAEFEHTLEKAEHLLAAVDRNTARVRTAGAWLSAAVVALFVPVFPLLSRGTSIGYS